MWSSSKVFEPTINFSKQNLTSKHHTSEHLLDQLVGRDCWMNNEGGQKALPAERVETLGDLEHFCQSPDDMACALVGETRGERNS